MLMAAALLWLRGSRVPPAILIGLTCWLKPQMILFVLWGLLRKQWRFTASLVLTFLAGVMLSVGMFGWHNSVEYLQVLDTWDSAAIPCSGINHSTDCSIA